MSYPSLLFYFIGLITLAENPTIIMPVIGIPVAVASTVISVAEMVGKHIVEDTLVKHKIQK